MENKISIIRPVGLNRSQQRIIYNDGSRVRRCRGPHNPVYYFDKDRRLKEIDVSAISTSEKSSIGGMIKKYANIRTIGIREDLKPTKFLGIRKDDDQEGNEQLEISLLSLKINNLEGSFTPQPMSIKSANIQDFGEFQIGASRQGVRFYVPYSNEIDSFELKLFIHATGLTPRKHDLLNEFWFENSKGYLFARFRQPNIFDSTGENTVWGIEPKIVIDHDLEQVEGGWIYTKYNTMPLAKLGLPIGSLIDGDIYYSTTADGYVSNSNATFSTCHDAASGNDKYDRGTDENVRCWLQIGTYTILRAFFYCDTSAVVAPISSALWSVHTYGCGGCNLSAGPSTQGAIIATSDFSKSHSSEWSHTYIPSKVTQNRVSGSATTTDIIDGTTKWSCREYDHDLLNSAPSDTSAYVLVYFTNYTGTTRDPYLDITEGATGWSGTFDGVASPGTVNGIDSANLGTANGI